MRIAQVAAVSFVAVLLCSCKHGTGLRHTSLVARGDRGFKPAGEVAPHARAMAEGEMTLEECLRQPESIADGGIGCMRAIRDLPSPAP